MVTLKDLSSLVVSLAIRGYIAIENKNGEFCFTRRTEDTAGLNGSEKLVFEAVGDVCESSFAETQAEKFREALNQSNSPLIAKDYIVNNDSRYRIDKGKSFLETVGIPLFLAVNPGAFFWILGAGFLGGVWPGVIFSGTCILIALVNLFLKPNHVYLTDKGLEAERRLLGLKLYMKVAEKDRIIFANAPAKTPELFEKLLPYAMVFGLEKKWMKEFEGLYGGTSSWYRGGTDSFSSIAFLGAVSSMNSSIQSSLISSAVQASSRSSWSSSSGGSSGGGGGGGGGGSW